MSIRILLADDHLILRQGLRSLLAQNQDFEVIGEAEDGRKAVEMAETLSPDVVVMDIGMPGLNGIEATRQIVARSRSVRVLALSAFADRKLIGEVLKAGASGYLLKDSAFEELAKAIRTAAANKVYLSPRIASEVVDDYVRMSKDPGAGAFDALSPREREVLQLIAEGNSTKEVARILKVSVKTVETHRRQLMNKLELFSVAELTRYAIGEGLVSLETRAGTPALAKADT
jgi:DNA-binding NarL/FixJ family response regulator